MGPKNRSEYEMWVRMPKEAVDLGDEAGESDPVDAPAHYAGDGEVDCRRAMESMHAGWHILAVGVAECGRLHDVVYFATCAFKYIWRWPGKGGLQDLKKARQCLDFAIERYEGKGAR